MFFLSTMRALEALPLTLPSWKRNVNKRGLERALPILSTRSYAIGRLHDFASEPFSAGFRTKLYGKHRNGSTQKAPRQQTFKFEEVRGDTTAKRVCAHILLLTCFNSRCSSRGAGFLRLLSAKTNAIASLRLGILRARGTSFSRMKR